MELSSASYSETTNWRYDTPFFPQIPSEHKKIVYLHPNTKENFTQPKRMLISAFGIHPQLC